ncbi:MAG: chromosome segregation protein SMC [Sedimentisphaerales bacterium]|nr:chromosome segregation protein SMC [Sedimentisphaerales bacterium]
MRLKKIVLDGFKSFADKTEFVFDRPLTAIVGPNGCGKSNVVDAVKWVLGEQRVKSLRSEQMADVIFNGSSSRKATASAEVSLFMSNPDGTKTGQLPIEADQIQISRRIYKSGESEYRINNRACRLKDVRELFMDTGVGTRAYSIIEQGEVEQLLNASKTDRRVVFEEAAGISKYKAHKRQALRKIEHAEQNLLRLADILAEVTKRLRSVKLQAGKARSYLQHTQRLKELQVNYFLAEYSENYAETELKNNTLEQAQQQYAAIAAEVAASDVLSSELGHKIIEAENKLKQADTSLVSVTSKIEQQLQRVDFLQSKMRELQQRKTSAVESIEKARRRGGELENDLKRHQAEQADNEKIIEEKKLSAEKIQQALEQTASECSSLEVELEDEKSGIIDIVRRTAQLHNEIQSISGYRSNLSNQKDRLTNQAQNAKSELEQLLTEKAQHEARMDDIEKVLAELQDRLDDKRKKAEQIGAQLDKDGERLAHSKEARSTLNGELAVLEDMEQRQQGLNNAAKAVLQSRSVDNSRFSYVEGLLADIVTADLKYAGAVEAALEGKTDALVISDAPKLLADIENIEKLDGRLNFISLDTIEPFVDKNDLSQFSNVKGRLVEFISSESKHAMLIWNLLGKTVIVDSIDAALKLSETLGKEYDFVTLTGRFFSGDGRIKLGPLGKAAGLISRKSRLRQLRQTIESINSEIASMQEQLKNNTQKKEHIAKLYKDLRTAIYEANTEKMQMASKLSINEQNIKRLRQQQPLLDSEITLLHNQISQSVQKEYDSKQRLDELETVNNQRAARIKELETKFQEQKVNQQFLNEQLTSLKVALGQLTEHQQALTDTIASMQIQLKENQSIVETTNREIQQCDQQCRQASRDILKSEASISDLFVKKEQSQQDSKQLQREITALAEQRNNIEQTVKEKKAGQADIEQQVNQVKIELGQLEVKSQDLVERVREELQIDLAEHFKNYNHSDIDWIEVKEQITELKAKIERLGNVNVDAIDEQEKLQERYGFLSSQLHDLNSSKAQLQQLINRLNKKSRQKFAETFEQIRINFQQIFRKLFGGGRADILLEDSDDILEAGIEIIAQPPGKETRNLSLLSGGEKSMTAIALLFAVFKTKPSPFCFLDEIDAALDEANNERFNLLLREFQKDSQFIVITHTKRTMSIADVLFGITMQRAGVSKKIGVKFGEYEEEQTVAVA